MARVRIKPVTVESQPYNAETPSQILCRSNVTPSEAFYVRNHFSAPRIQSKLWNLRVVGAVRNSLALSLNEISSMPAKKLLVTMECAGNGRSMMQPLPPSTPWRDCAVATAEWLGVPLKTVLEKAQPEENVLEVLFLGADAGIEGGRELSFARSLPLEEATQDDVILAYKMNGHPIPLMHGFPVRLIVPGWYGMASVKWLTEIRALTEPYEGHFQKDRYIYASCRNMTDSPVSRIRVKSLILEPSERAAVKLGKTLKVSGLAWSGSGRIRKVEFRTQDTDWTETRLSHDDLSPYVWSRWSINWRPKAKGRYVLTSRAFDDKGSSQPEDPVWNIHGYGYNSVPTRIVMVV